MKIEVGTSNRGQRGPVRRDVLEAQGVQARMAIVPTSGTLEERLVQAGIERANLTLAEESIALMRLTIAEARAFPERGHEGFRIGFDGCARYIAECLATDASDAAIRDATPMAARFVEMALHPLYMHARFGADLAGWCERATQDVPEVVEILLSREPDPTMLSPDTLGFLRKLDRNTTKDWFDRHRDAYQSAHEGVRLAPPDQRQRP